MSFLAISTTPSLGLLSPSTFSLFSPQVNGVRTDLPIKVLTSVSVTRLPDGSVLLQQKAGVRVQFWPSGQLSVMVGRDHAGMLCGACGNFDGNQANDDNSQGHTPMETWRAPDFSSW